MRVEVPMPQMGESIAEGTITRWMKKVGDKVERDEPIFEISTDKVDAEIPSPSAGVLVEIRNQEGETVPVNEIVAVIETEAEEAASAGEPAPEKREAKPSEPEAKAPAKKVAAAPAPPSATPPRAAGAGGTRGFVSPVVRRIADEHGIDPSRVPGSGAGGRVTKKDILAFLESREQPPEAAPPRPAAPSFPPGERTRRETMSVMRRKIAEHMIESRRTSAHVHSVFEVDMTHLVGLRERHAADYTERHGVKPSYTAFLVRAVCDGLKSWPVLNAAVDGDAIVYKKDLNIGVAVALDWGLIVPVIRQADELSVAGLSRRIADLAQRARGKQLNPDEVQSGTFTITNPGQFGALYGLPIINQPQVAILGVGGIQKRPVVIDDAIAIRSMMYLALSFDHRIVDGAVADQFLAQVKRFLEEFDEALL